MVWTSEKENTCTQLLFQAYSKEKASHKQVFLAGFPASAEIAHIYCDWSWQTVCYVGEIQISHFLKILQRKDEGKGIKSWIWRSLRTTYLGKWEYSKKSFQSFHITKELWEKKKITYWGVPQHPATDNHLLPHFNKSKPVFIVKSYWIPGKGSTQLMQLQSLASNYIFSSLVSIESWN